MPDKTLTCRDCGTNFTFTVAEQDFFSSKGFTNEPGRCPSCRGARSQPRGGGPSGPNTGYQRREQQMYPTICAQCGKDTQVPFQPRGDRPVYCSTCYQAQRGSSGGHRRSGGSR